MLGRNRVLDELRAHLNDEARGLGVVVVAGVAGVGKTTVWRALTAEAEARALVLRAVAVEAEATLGFTAIADLVSSIDDANLDLLPAPQRHALEVTMFRADPGERPLSPRAVAVATGTLLERCASQGPVVVAIDDAQWLDNASAHALTFALRRLPRLAPITFLLARREQGDGEQLFGAEPSTFDAHRVVLDALSSIDIRRLLEDRFSTRLDAEAMQAVVRAARGNPMAAMELARGRVEGRTVDVARASAANLPDLLADRLRVLSDEALHVVVAAALSGSPTVEVLEQLTDDAAPGLQEARRSGVLDVSGSRVSFKHPLLALAARSFFEPAVQRAFHASLASVVRDPEEVARHLSLAITSWDESVAERIERGAHRARDRGAWETAGELLEQAALLSDPDAGGHPTRLAIEAAEHYVYAGAFDRARRLLEAIERRGLTPEHRAAVLRILGWISHRDRSLSTSIEQLRMSLALHDHGRDGALAHLVFGYVLANDMAWAESLRHAEQARERAAASGEVSLRAAADALIVMSRYLLGEGADWPRIERAVRDEAPERLLPLTQRPSTLDALLHLYVGSHDEAHTRLDAVIESSRLSGDETDLCFGLMWKSWLLVRTGLLLEAAATAREALASARMVGASSQEAWAKMQLAYTLAHAGDSAGALSICAATASDITTHQLRLPLLWLAGTRAVAHLVDADAGAAWDACEQFVQLIEAHGLGEPVPYFFLPDAIEALVELGHLDRAEALLDQLDDRGRRLDRGWALVAAKSGRGSLYAARGEHDAAADAFDDALVLHEALQFPLDHARTLLAFGRAERRAGHRRTARRHLEDAQNRFVAMGAAGWAQGARTELARVPGRRPATDPQALTPTEVEVARLVAAGRSNRQLSVTLGISPKTVERHLSALHRKLGTTTRAELALVLSQRF